MLKAARIRSRICDVILGLVTKCHMKREHNLLRSKKYFHLFRPIFLVQFVLSCITLTMYLNPNFMNCELFLKDL